MTEYLASSLASVLRACFRELRELAGPEVPKIEAAEALTERHTGRPPGRGSSKTAALFLD